MCKKAVSDHHKGAAEKGEKETPSTSKNRFLLKRPRRAAVRKDETKAQSRCITARHVREKKKNGKKVSFLTPPPKEGEEFGTLCDHS